MYPTFAQTKICGNVFALYAYLSIFLSLNVFFCIKDRMIFDGPKPNYKTEMLRKILRLCLQRQFQPNANLLQETTAAATLPAYGKG